MQYSKAMIDLIQAARRVAPAESKASIKLTNPDVLGVLTNLYHQSKDGGFRSLIKDLSDAAGDEWPAQLNLAEPTAMLSEKGSEQVITRIYRGKTIVQKRPATTPVASAGQIAASKDRPKRMYRGTLVS